MLDMPAMNVLRNALLPLLALSLFAGTCPGPGPQPDDDDDSTDSDPCEGIDSIDGTAIDLEVFVDDLDDPVHVTHAGDGTGRIFVVEQGGQIVAVDATGEASDWLDLGSEISSGGERGLLSVAFHPAFAANGRLFLYADTWAPKNSFCVSRTSGAKRASRCPDDTMYTPRTPLKVKSVTHQIDLKI